jgi:proteasome lid subunit RPN8/RPN11
MTQRAYVRCCAHAGSDLNNEVGGALAGKWRADAQTGQPFIVIEAALPARHTRQSGSYVTFTQDSLVALHDDLDERHPGKELVGWYHTHPRMGVFLSGYDVWLHQHFFPNPWQVALVIEPYTSQGGFFIPHSDGRLDPRRYVGFYELSKNGRRTVVAWRNLRLDAAAPPAEGG